MPVLATLNTLLDIWTNTIPTTGVIATSIALPVRAKYVVCDLDYTGAGSTTININVLGSVDGVTWAILGSFTEVIDTAKRFDCEGYKFISAVITAHTGPQNTTLSISTSEK